MKIASLVLLAALAACKKSPQPAGSQAQDARKTPTGNPVEYAESLKKDAEKAQAVRDKANEALQQQTQQIDGTLKEAEGR